MAVTPPDVAAWADLELDEAGLAAMTKVVAAVYAYLAPRYNVPATEPADVTLAVTMQSARLFKRRGTPEGVAGFGADFVYRVSKLDPDVDELLAPYRKWVCA